MTLAAIVSALGGLVLAFLGVFFAGKKTGQATGAKATAEAGQVVIAATAAVEQSKATVETAKKVQDATASVSPDRDAALAVLRDHTARRAGPGPHK
jgi:hypothetical protein